MSSNDTATSKGPPHRGTGLPCVSITHREEFSAAHKLESPSLDAAANLALYGPCYRVHGHNYAVEATVSGPVDARTGMVMNLTELMRIMRSEIWVEVDHKYLNEDVPFLRGIIPTAENLAIAFWERLAAQSAALAPATLERVRVVESAANFVDYFGPGRSPGGVGIRDDDVATTMARGAAAPAGEPSKADPRGGKP